MPEKRRFCIEHAIRPAELGGRRLVCLFDFTAEAVDQKLRAVANTENGHAQLENFFIHSRGIFEIDRIRPAREYNALRVHTADFFDRRLVRLYFAVNFVLAHSSCY